jgi:hypothetical protein
MGVGLSAPILTNKEENIMDKKLSHSHRKVRKVLRNQSGAISTLAQLLSISI